MIADRQPRVKAANVLSTMAFAIHAMPLLRCCIHTPPEPALAVRRPGMLRSELRYSVSHSYVQCARVVRSVSDDRT